MAIEPVAIALYLILTTAEEDAGQSPPLFYDRLGIYIGSRIRNS